MRDSFSNVHDQQRELREEILAKHRSAAGRIARAIRSKDFTEIRNLCDEVNEAEVMLKLTQGLDK